MIVKQEVTRIPINICLPVDPDSIADLIKPGGTVPEPQEGDVVRECECGSQIWVGPICLKLADVGRMRLLCARCAIVALKLVDAKGDSIVTITT